MFSRLKAMCGRTIGWGRLFYAAFSGDVGKMTDNHYREMWSRINHGRFKHHSTVFSIDVEPRRGESEESGYKTIWIKTPNGAYCVVKTFTSEGLLEEPEPAYTLLFSPDPSVLGRNFLYGQNKQFHFSQESKDSIHVISARREKDISLKIPRIGDVAKNEDWERLPPHLDFSWIKRDIDKHGVHYETNLHRHGVLIEKGNTWRSASSAFWLEEHKNRDENGNCAGAKKYHVYYYANPIHGGDGFLAKGALENPKIRAALKPLSMRLTGNPVARNDAKEIIQRRFVQFANAIIQRRDPYRLNIPDYNPEGDTFRDSRTRAFLRVHSLRTCQKMLSAIASVQFKSLVTSLASTGIVSVLLFTANILPAIFGILATPKTNFLVSGPMAMLRRASQFISPVERAKIRTDGDIVERYAVPGDDHFQIEGATLKLNPNYLPHMRPVDFQLLKDIFPKTKKFTTSSELIWAKNKIYDTMGQPGTIFSQSIKHGTLWLRAWHPEGVKAYHNPEARITLAQIAHAPLPGSVLEKPVAHLFETLSPSEKILCITLSSSGELKTRGLKEHEPPPVKGFITPIADQTPTVSIEAFKNMLSKEKADREARSLAATARCGLRGMLLAQFISHAEPDTKECTQPHMSQVIQIFAHVPIRPALMPT